jgi:hypothetical protein
MKADFEKVIASDMFDKNNINDLKEQLQKEYEKDKNKIAQKFKIATEARKYILKNRCRGTTILKEENLLLMAYIEKEKEELNKKHDILQKEVNNIEWYIHWKKCYNPKISEYKRQRIKYLYECGESLYNICVMCDCELADIYVVCGGFRIVKE